MCGDCGRDGGAFGAATESNTIRLFDRWPAGCQKVTCHERRHRYLSLLVAHSRPLFFFFFFFFADYPLLFRHGREAERRLERLQDGHEGGKLGPGL